MTSPPGAAEQGRGKTLEPARERPSPQMAPTAREPRAGAQRGQPAMPPPAGAAAGAPRGGKAPEQPARTKPPTTPPNSAGQAEARGAREKQGAVRQPVQPRGGAPAAAEQRGQAKPEQGKKKSEGTPQPRP
jgi:hypothetical protein